jgi:PAS domain S-box-containing protein
MIIVNSKFSDVSYNLIFSSQTKIHWMAGSDSKWGANKRDSIVQRVSNFISFFDTIDHLLCVVDMDGLFIDVNRSGLDLLGYNMDELYGRDAEMIFREEDKADIVSQYQQVKENGFGEWNYPIITKTGRKIPSSISFHKGVWDNKDAFFVVGKNISSEMMMSEARKISLRLISSAESGDADSIIRIALEETIKLTGSSIGFLGAYDEGTGNLTDTVWLTDNTIFSGNSFSERMEMGHNREWISMISRRQPIILSQEHISAMGKAAKTLLNGMVVPLVVENKITYLLGLGNKAGDYNEQDVNLISILWDNVTSELKRIRVQNELRESEYEYRNLFESSRDALLLYDLSSSRIVLCNDATLKIFGYKSQEELLSISPMDLSAEVQPDGLPSGESLDGNASRAMSESVYIPNWVHKRKNGEEFSAEVILSPVNYKGKQIVLANVRDITDRLKVESDLERSQASFNIAVKEGGLGIWDYDVERREMILGQGFWNLIGRKRRGGTMNVDDWLSMIHPDDLETVGRRFTKHIEGQSSEYRGEYRIMNPDGGYKWIQISGKGLDRDEEGKAKRVVGVIIDVDSTKKLSKQVEETRNFLETIISSIEAILFVKDADGKYLLVNRAFTEKLGLDQIEIIGKTSEELKLSLDIDSRLSDDIVIQQGVEQTYEQELRLSDGRLYDYLITKIPIRGKDGEVYAQVGLATDITHIKELEKDLRDNVFSLDAAVNGTGNGLWDWNPARDELVLNDNWFGMLGYTRSQFNKKYRRFNFRTFADFVHPEDMKKIEKELEKHYAGQTEYYRIEFRMLTSDDQWKWILASGKVWEWDKDNNPTRMVGIHIDIDYRVRIEEQLKQALVKAEESDRLKSAFLANMSHEIRTPMNGIIGFLDLMDTDEMPREERKEYMSIIRSSSNQLLNIVNDIVDISKIEAGQVTIRNSPVDLPKLFEDLRMQYRPALDDKKLSLELECFLEDDEKTIISDHTKLRQILSNLISNSIKFTESGGIKIQCRKTGLNIEFSVEDSGYGIPPEMHKRVFERFIQAESGLSRLQEGTGLGLSICKAYVEKLGGRIWLKSVPGEGSVFYFTIPFVVDPDPEVKRPAEPIKDENSEGLILIVEDEIYNFLFVEQILQNRGLRVLHAENGTIALEMLSKHRDIELVLMDIRLPGMDGYETTRRIKEKMPHLPVVALTALALSGDREKAIQAGCDDYLKKPVLREELLNVVDRVFSAG